MINLNQLSLPESFLDFDPEKYIVDPHLLEAAKLAIALNQPLLLTGEPGTGKTKMAFKLADILHKASTGGLNFAAEPLVFNTKTTSAARDLFYTYDAVSHFQEANIKKAETDKKAKTSDFINLQALGLAIAKTNPAQLDKQPALRGEIGDQPTSNVVLIDEIDKAPRDFPNDILNEIEQYEFQIKELDNLLITSKGNQRIVIVMTSNSEKNLPEAFLRRCVFYHIPFPDDKRLMEIAQKQLGEATPHTKELLKDLIAHFRKIRKHSIRKKPATAELIAWLRLLGLPEVIKMDDAKKADYLKANLSILVKTREDLEAVRAAFKL